MLLCYRGKVSHFYHIQGFVYTGPALQRGPGGPRPTQHFRPDDVIVTWRNR